MWQVWNTIDTLINDENIVVLPADKGQMMVVMKKDKYVEKYNQLLNDE